MLESANQKIDEVDIDEKLCLGIDYNSTDASAISVATLVTVLTSGGAETRTLPNGREGQVKILLGGSTVTGAITVTPAAMNGYSNVAIGDEGRGVILLFSKGKWSIIALGYATGA